MIIGLDVGGTHTDVVLLSRDGVMNETKVLTDPENLFESVLEGLENVTKGVDPNAIHRTVLSTTLTTNAIVQGKTEPVGMIVSSGPGVDPEFYRIGANFFKATGSIDHRGREIQGVDHSEIERIGTEWKQKGIRFIGIVGKFSIRNPAHENEICRILSPSFEKIFLGHQISGNLNFPRRIASTYLNATVFPIHKHFFQSVKKSLDQKGLKIPIHILKADGGTMNFESSIDFPGQTILSGPAASVMGTIPFAGEKEDVLVMDIGGTTTDMAVLIDRVPVLNPLGITLGPYQTLIRSIETHSIGLGGDSVVRMSNNQLEIGPERIGRAMAFGGTTLTPTDALFVLGLMNNGDRAQSLKGILPIAESLGESPEACANRIFDQTCRKILTEARGLISRINSKPVYTIKELQEGYQVSPKKVLIIGGPAPYFADRLNQLSDFSVSVVPKWGVANAIGAGLARTTCEVSLFADTQRAIAVAPEENFSESITKKYSKEQAVQKAFDLLRQKALKIGASEEDLNFEVIESLQFNMVDGFYTTGRNIRVKVQVIPGVISGYEFLSSKL